MTTKSSGAIIYYDQDGGPVRRVVTAGDVAAMEAELTALRSAYAVAAAIMRARPVWIAPRLVSEWRAAVEAVSSRVESGDFVWGKVESDVKETYIMPKPK